MKKNSICIFLGVEGLLFFLFVWIDIFHAEFQLISPYLKYAAIISCFLFSFYQRKSHLLILCLGLTVLADFFLLFTNNYVMGVAIFCMVQIGYRLYLNRPLFSFLVSGFLGMAVFNTFCILAAIPLDVTSVFCSLYITYSIQNIVTSWKASHRLFALSITLLFLCDIHVGIFNLSNYFPILPGSFFAYWQLVSSAAMWMFYLPAEVLLAITSIVNKSEDFTLEFFKQFLPGSH